MESGLIQLVVALLSRMNARLGGDVDHLVEYVINNAAAWSFPEIVNEKAEDRERAVADWERHIATLDTAVLSLIGENDIPDNGIEAALDDILRSSLWHRRLQRYDDPTRRALKAAGFKVYDDPAAKSVSLAPFEAEDGTEESDPPPNGWPW